MALCVQGAVMTFRWTPFLRVLGFPLLLSAVYLAQLKNNSPI